MKHQHVRQILETPPDRFLQVQIKSVDDSSKGRTTFRLLWLLDVAYCSTPYSMDWFVGENLQETNGFLPSNWLGFPVNLPIIQFYDTCNCIKPNKNKLGEWLPTVVHDFENELFAPPGKENC